MYHAATGVGTGASTAMLPYTGINLIWLLVAGFTLLMMGGALMRATRKQKDDDA
jgi:LPXTG-motif cell wall-anchored protein